MKKLKGSRKERERRKGEKKDDGKKLKIKKEVKKVEW